MQAGQRGQIIGSPGLTRIVVGTELQRVDQKHDSRNLVGDPEDCRAGALRRGRGPGLLSKASIVFCHPRHPLQSNPARTGEGAALRERGWISVRGLVRRAVTNQNL